MSDIDPQVLRLAAAMEADPAELLELGELQKQYHAALLAKVPSDQWAVSVPIQLALGQLRARGLDPRELLPLAEHWVGVFLERERAEEDTEEVPR